MKKHSLRIYGVLLLIVCPFLLLTGGLQGMMSDSPDVSPEVASFLASIWFPYSLLLFICSVLLIFNVHFVKKLALALIFYFPLGYVANMTIALVTKNLNMAIAYWAIFLSFILGIYLFVNRFLKSKIGKRYITMEKHITIVGVLHIAIFFLVPIIGVIYAGFLSGEEELTSISQSMRLVLILSLIIISLPGIIGGIGLLKHRSWARILILVLGFLNLINIPAGTILGIYTIWVLMKGETIRLFTSVPTTKKAAPVR